MGHFAGLSGPSSRRREDAVSAAACWLLAAMPGWGGRLGGEQESELETALRDPFLEKKQAPDTAKFHPGSEQNVEVRREVKQQVPLQSTPLRPAVIAASLHSSGGAAMPEEDWLELPSIASLSSFGEPSGS